MINVHQWHVTQTETTTADKISYFNKSKKRDKKTSALIVMWAIPEAYLTGIP